ARVIRKAPARERTPRSVRGSQATSVAHRGSRRRRGDASLCRARRERAAPPARRVRGGPLGREVEVPAARARCPRTKAALLLRLRQADLVRDALAKSSAARPDRPRRAL